MVGGHVKDARSHEHQKKEHYVFANFNLRFNQHTTYNINYALKQHVSTEGEGFHQATLKPS